MFLRGESVNRVVIEASIRNSFSFSNFKIKKYKFFISLTTVRELKRSKQYKSLTAVRYLNTTMPNEITPYQLLLEEIVTEIERHRIKAAQELNTTQMQLYFTIGGNIVRKQQAEGWGKSVVEQLAADLKKLTGSGESFGTCYRAESDEFCDSFVSCVALATQPSVAILIAIACSCNA